MKELFYIQQNLKVSKDNQGYGYKFRSAEDILEKAKPLLHDMQCVVICNSEYATIGEKLYQKTTAELWSIEQGKKVAEASAMCQEPSEMKGMAGQQISGSTTTYCKRYALQNLFAIDNTEDDVDAVVSKAETTTKVAPQPVKASTPKATAEPTIDKKVEAVSKFFNSGEKGVAAQKYYCAKYQVNNITYLNADRYAEIYAQLKEAKKI